MNIRHIRFFMLGSAIGCWWSIETPRVARWLYPVPTCSGGMPIAPPSSKFNQLIAKLKTERHSLELPKVDKYECYPEDAPSFRAWLAARESRRCVRCDQSVGDLPLGHTLCLDCRIKERRAHEEQRDIAPPQPPIPLPHPAKAIFNCKRCRHTLCGNPNAPCPYCGYRPPKNRRNGDASAPSPAPTQLHQQKEN